jgi:hypothetical protein
MRRDKSVVTARQVTRYYVFGRGYNSSLAAHMQIAKRYVERLYIDAAGRIGWKEMDAFAKRWYSERYPVREACPCSFCYSGGTRTPSNSRHGCWFSKMADYRQIAREIMSGRRNPDGSELPKALPQRAGAA